MTFSLYFLPENLSLSAMKTRHLNKWILICMLCIACGGEAYAGRQVVDSLLTVASKSNDSIRALAYFDIAWYYRNVSVDSAELFCHKTIKLGKEIGFLKIEGESYGLLGVLERTRGNFETALQWFLKALKIKEAMKDEHGLTVTYNDLGVLYKSMKRWDEALEQYRKSNALCIKLNSGEGTAMTYNNIGTVFLGKNMQDSAFAYYKKALDVAVSIKSDYARIIALSNMGDVYMDWKEYDKAADAFKQCLAYDKANDDKYGMSLSYFQVARVYDAMGQYKTAIAYADTAAAIARGESFATVLVDILPVMASIYEHDGNFAKAFEYMKQSRSLSDSVMSATTNDKISELQTQYETVKKEQQIEKQQTDIRNKNYVIWGLALLMALAGMLGYSMYRRYKLKQSTRLQAALLEQQESATLAVLEAEERERKRIATDLHDGVGQMMSAARMNLSVLVNELDEDQQAIFDKAMHLVDESCKEVRQVSHNIMPNTLAKRGLVYALNEFINTMDKRALDINLYADNMEERLPVNVEIMLYRAVQECVNNVIKHAAASTVNISIVKDEKEISISIEDNGRGFDPKAQNPEKGIGLRNIETRIQYLKGTVSWDTARGKGTVVMMYVPAVTYAASYKQAAFN